MNENKTKIERAVLAGLSADCFPPEERSSEVSMEELSALVETAGGESAAWLIQQRPAPDPHSFLGEGKVRQLKEIIENEGCTLAVFDNELSPSQMRVLSEELGVKVLDRSGLILDIFAQRARTREGQLQVELAQYKYLLPRLLGMWKHLERQEGAIGTRGPGETQLESDRRHIRRKISRLQDELEEVRRTRAVQRRRREKNAVPVAALVGYTNAGKSTLLNRLTGSDIPANNRLFDTLDTTTRHLRLDEVSDVLVSDTVGFIRKLPTHLVEAFKATLEELAFADVLLHVIDLSNPEWQTQAEIVDRLIVQLDAAGTPCIRIYNKCDVFSGDLPRERESVCVSARTGEGLDALRKMLGETLSRTKRRGRFLVPYTEGALLELLHRDGAVLSTAYESEGTLVEAIMGPELWSRFAKYAVGIG